MGLGRQRKRGGEESRQLSGLRAVFHKADRRKAGLLSLRGLERALGSSPAGAAASRPLSRLLLGAFGKRGRLTFPEFTSLWQQLKEWTAAFRLGAGEEEAVDHEGLAVALRCLPIGRLTSGFREFLLAHFDAGREPEMELGAFIQAAAILQAADALFVAHGGGEDEAILLHFEDWLTDVFRLCRSLQGIHRPRPLLPLRKTSSLNLSV